MAFKACPFCGSNNIMLNLVQGLCGSENRLYVNCLDCEAQCPSIFIERPKNSNNIDDYRVLTSKEMDEILMDESLRQKCEEQWNRRDG